MTPSADSTDGRDKDAPRASPRCSYCGTSLTVAGHTTHYYWCGACRCAVDPAVQPPDKHKLMRKGILAAWTRRKGRSSGSGVPRCKS
jgi:ribosomal protein S27AE